MSKLAGIVAATVVSVCLGPVAQAGSRFIDAVPRQGPIVIDGKLDDAAWQGVPIATDFVQRQPKDLAPPAFPTSFRVAFDDDALYIAAEARDPEPSKIKALLHRRDLPSSADWMFVWIDSYDDNKSAFGFGLNAASVQSDFVIYNDVNEDSSWDGVWDGHAEINADGWTAEWRIPLSQLRFSKGKPAWGVQVTRNIGRTGEQDTWAPAPRATPRFVGFFGELRGLGGLAPKRRLELLPYVIAGLGLEEGGGLGTSDVATVLSAGGDVKVGLGSSFTLAATFNPDFGQVEADPSTINLSGNELFLAEKRPFFLEGADQFRFAAADDDSDIKSLFYSRRLGGAAHDDVEPGRGTTILGAAKLVGKTERGTSMGILSAVTQEETSPLAAAPSGIIEPLTTYTFLVLKQDFREARSTLTAAAGHVWRDLDDTWAKLLHRDAETGGLAYAHRFGDDAWNVSAKAVGSLVHADADALALTQRQLRHLYQRVDATHLNYDPTATRMAGYGLFWRAGKDGGDDHWRVITGGEYMSAGMELNDLGFAPHAEGWFSWLWGQYVEQTPGDHLLRYDASADAWIAGDTSGAVHGRGGSLSASALFANYWSARLSVGYEDSRWDVTALRGGPALRGIPSIETNFSIGSDGRKAVTGYLNGRAWRRAGDDSVSSSLSTGVAGRVRSNLEFATDLAVSADSNARQYVGEIVDSENNTRYLAARLRQLVTSITLRADWTISPEMSLQLYAQPFWASGAYSEFKEPTSPRAKDPEAQLGIFGQGEFSERDGQYFVERGGSFAFGKPDFGVLDLRTTLVYRWQFRPGSTLYGIWSSGRFDANGEGRFDLADTWAHLRDGRGEHRLLVKANYWFG